METIQLNLDIGTLRLKKRGKKGIIWLDITFHDLESKRRFRTSTKTNRIKQAEPIAITLAQDEYRRRKSGIHLQRNTSPYKYMKHTHIPWMFEQVGLPLDNKPKIIMTRRKAKNDVDVMNKWLLKILEGKTWESLTTTAFGRDLVSYLRRQKLHDATISKYVGILNRFMRQAEMDGFAEKNQITKPALNQTGKTSNTYAIATDEMVFGLLDLAKSKMEKATRKDLRRTYTQVYSWLRIIADTGMRPFTVCPLTFEDIKEDGDIIYIKRAEKSKTYLAQGGAITRQALDDLRELYLSEGTNVNQNKHLPLIHHPKKGNTYNQTHVEPFSQIKRFHLAINRLMRASGWYKLEDEEGKIFRAYSLRKWHINKSIDNGEDRFQIADRVGHDYAVLEKFYLNKNRKQEVKADIWTTNTPTNTIGIDGRTR